MSNRYPQRLWPHLVDDDEVSVLSPVEESDAVAAEEVVWNGRHRQLIFGLNDPPPEEDDDDDEDVEDDTEASGEEEDVSEVSEDEVEEEAAKFTGGGGNTGEQLDNTGGQEQQHPAKKWIRGVNLGGWLLAERFVTPYLFALSECDLKGDFRTFPHQLSPPDDDGQGLHKNDLKECPPVNNGSYPVDEYTLTKAFGSKALARAYLERHWSTFVTGSDLVAIKESGATHVRVPLPHWIFDPSDDEPYVDGQWPHFLRVCKWARELKLEVWPDVHTAPGSQNGFDNSGHLLKGPPTGLHWSNSTVNVERSLNVVRELVKRIVSSNLTDVVTGIGPLNEPFLDVPIAIMKKFDEDALEIIRGGGGTGTEGGGMPKDTAVYVADLFNSTRWANETGGWFWTDGDKYRNTYLDSHYYHVFAEAPRSLSPKQHIAYVCRKNYRDTVACCYDKDTREASRGISRIVGEWSASVDTLPVDKLSDVMNEIAKTGKALEFDRTISPARAEFLKNFVEAQMVMYEAADVGVSSGWFFWNFKMEGGAFAEWDYLRGVEEGWIPKIEPGVASQDRFGSCESILLRTKDDDSIIDEFPDPSTLPDNYWQGPDIDDDLVVSHGDTLLDGVAESSESRQKTGGGGYHGGGGGAIASDKADKMVVPAEPPSSMHFGNVFLFAMFGTFCWLGYKKWRRQEHAYSALHHGHPGGHQGMELSV